jgi:hypothetical protein
MARAGSYTPLKRTVMQAVMWCVLLAAIGAAALVDRQLKPMSGAQLGPLESSGILHYRLPVGWAAEPSTDRNVAVVAIDPVNPSAVGPRRTLVVYHRRIFTLTGPVDYLQSSGLMEQIFGNSSDAIKQVEQTTLAGAPAILLRGQSAVPTNGETVLESDLVICCVFPNHHAVTLWLAKLGPMTSMDQNLFNQVAQSVRMGSLPTVGPN